MQGDRPSGPPASDFVTANTSYVVLHLDRWDDHRCDILYFVVEYKLSREDTWTIGEERSNKVKEQRIKEFQF